MLQRAHQILRDVYGFDEFRGPQADIIVGVARGEDALVLMPTGGGKSLCYQLPALLREGVGIVVSPLIALMQDQVDALVRLGVRAACLNSTLEPEAQREVERQLRDGELDLLYIAPERLLQSRTLTLLEGLTVALFAIDEAHCVAQWGHDFRRDYLGLEVLARRFPAVPRIALTATAEAATREEIAQRLKLTHARRFISSFDRPNLRYLVEPRQNGRRQLLSFLARRRGQSGIIYCLSRNNVERTAEWLQQQGWNALPYHAGLEARLRAHHQRRFLAEEGIVMVATIAFGMGIDKPDVRFVVHTALPRSMEAYYQETGRAGRDGAPADVWMTYGLSDVVRLREMVASGEGNDEFKQRERQRLEALLGWCELTSCRRTALLAYFGEQAPGPCGNCDNCLKPPRTWDATEAARKLLSCVYRVGQRFGAGHIIDVLRGRDHDKIRQHGHQRLSTFGIGREVSANQWQSLIRQLLARGELAVEPGHYGTLRLTEASRPLLRGTTRLALRVDEGETVLPQHRERLPMNDRERALWEALRRCRLELAEAEGMPPYVIFHDRTLQAMVKLKPDRLEDLLQLPGVGQAKLGRYGRAFFDVIEQHQPTEIGEGG